MMLFGRLALCTLCGLLLLSCGGDPSTESTTFPPGTQKAEAVLMPDVRILTAEENSQVSEASPTSLTINGSLSLDPGTVFITADTAYKVVSAENRSGQVILIVENPAVEEIFSKIDIEGVYAVTTDNETNDPTRATAEPAISPGPRVLATTTTTSLSVPAKIELGAITGTTNTTATLGLTVDYHFDRAAGGLTSGSVAVDANIATILEANLKKEGAAEKSFKIKDYYIPINLTIYDRLLNLLGARVAGIYIPVGIVVKGSAEFEAKISIKSEFKGRAIARFKNGAGTTTSTSDGSMTMETPTLTPEEGVTATAGLGVYFNVRPALSALRSVALSGVDLRAGPRAALKIRSSKERIPPYCLDLKGFAHAEVSSFFTTIGFFAISEADVYEEKVFEKPLIGSCLAPTTVAITKVEGESTPSVFGDLLTVDVEVRPVAGSDIPGKIPTRNVTVKLGTEQCLTVIQANGTGRCTVKAGAVGEGVSLEAMYSGDVDYEQSQTFMLINIAKSPTIATLSFSPNPAIPNGLITLTSVLGPRPDRGQRPLPTGTVTFTSGSGTTLCSALADSAGTATCTMSFSGVTEIQARAHYPGDKNYQGTQSVQVSIGSGTPVNTVTMTQWVCTALSDNTFAVELDGVARTNINLVGPDAFFTLFGESENTTAINAITTCSAWPGRKMSPEGGSYCSYRNGDPETTNVHSRNVSTKAGAQFAWFMLDAYNPVSQPDSPVFHFEHKFPIFCPGAGVAQQ